METTDIIERASAASVRTFDQTCHESWDVSCRAAGLAAVRVVLNALDTMTHDQAAAAIVGMKAELDALADRVHNETTGASGNAR